MTALIVPLREAGFPVHRDGYYGLVVCGVRFDAWQRASGAVYLSSAGGFRNRTVRGRHGGYNVSKVAVQIVRELPRLLDWHKRVQDREQLLQMAKDASDSAGELTGGRMSIHVVGNEFEVRVRMADFVAACAMSEQIAESWGARIAETA